jgi:hypothetical protein
MADVDRRTAFNSPLETGVRSLSILVAAFPLLFDLQRLVELDYLVVHSGDANGPDSLHAPLPLRAGELLVRRELIANGLLLMMSRNLVVRTPSPVGIEYGASDAAAPFLMMLESDYSLRLRERAQWAVQEFGSLSSDEIGAITRGFFERWTSQFQPPQTPGLLL